MYNYTNGMLLLHVQTETTCIPFVYNKNKIKRESEPVHFHVHQSSSMPFLGSCRPKFYSNITVLIFAINIVLLEVKNKKGIKHHI